MNTHLFFVSSTRRSCLGRMVGSKSAKSGVHTFGAPCVIRRKSTRYVRKITGVAKTGAVARGLDFIQTDAGSGYCGRVFGEVLKWLSQEHEGGFVS